MSPPASPLRVAIIGCGKIADLHVLAIRRLRGCELVALCDRELLMAKQLGERFGVTACYDDVADLLQEARVDVVHVSTPPLTHFPLAKQCLEAGVHVYLEKPFTITAPEAEELVKLAQSRGLQLTAGHNLQFTPPMLAMRRNLKKGFLGGNPVHLESHFSYGLEEAASYVVPILGDRNHWVRKLPGQLFHNLVSHGIAKLAEFLDDGPLEVVARASQSTELRSLGGGEIMDELRVLLKDGNGTTAFFCFSTQLRPGLNLLKVFGPTGTVIVNHASGTLLRHRAHGDKSYLTFFLPPLREARQHFINGLGNMWAFARRRLYQDFGMKELIGRFYDSIRGEAEPPIPSREILLTARIMDEIFAQVYPDASNGDHGDTMEKQSSHRTETVVLSRSQQT